MEGGGRGGGGGVGGGGGRGGGEGRRRRGGGEEEDECKCGLFYNCNIAVYVEMMSVCVCNTTKLWGVVTCLV